MQRRIQRKRERGWRMPSNTVSVTRPGRWGNPYRVPAYAPDLALEMFRLYAHNRLCIEPGWLAPLRGKNLACWCKPGDPCHADILLALANR